MGIYTVQLPDDLEQFLNDSVSSGNYADANAVMQDALRALEREKREEEEKLMALHKAIEEGEASGIFEGDAFESVRKKMGWITER